VSARTEKIPYVLFHDRRGTWAILAPGAVEKHRFLSGTTVQTFKETTMKKIIASLATAAIALASASVFAQDAAPAAASAAAPAAASAVKHDKSKPHHALKQHGSAKGKAKAAAASEAGTNDKGATQ
jgi:hypothetical protein